MGSKIPCEYLLQPPVCYDPAAPPFIAPINFHPDLQSLVPFISGQVINEVSQKASNNDLRRLAFNIFCSNNWQNDEFVEVCQLVHDALLLACNKGVYRDPFNGLVETVVRVVGYYTSSLIVAFQYVKQNLTREVVEGAYQNLGLFNDLKAELRTMSWFNQPNQGMQMMGGTNIVMVGNVPHQAVVGQNGQIVMVPINANMNGQMMGGYVNPQMMQQRHNAGFNTAPAQHHQPHNHVFSSGPIQNNSNELSESQSRFMSRYKRTEPENAVEEAPKEKPVSKPQDDGPLFLMLESGGNEMNRAQHRIAYFGEPLIGLDHKERHETATAATKALATGNMISEDQINTQLHSSILGSVSYSEAIQKLISIQIEGQGARIGTSLFRGFFLIYHPYITLSNFDGFFKELRSSTTFSEIADVIKSQMASAEKVLGVVKNDPEKSVYYNELISTCLSIDHYLTNRVNHAVQRRLNLRLRISSFTEDITALTDRLLQIGSHAIREFNKHMTEVMDSFTISTPENFTEFSGLPQINPDLHFVNAVTEQISITRTFQNSVELGYLTDSNQGLLINQQSTPNLWRIVSSILDDSRTMQVITARDFILTSDGVLYLYYRVGNTDFMLERYSS